MLRVGFVGHLDIAEEPEAGLLVRPDRARVLHRWTDHAFRDVVAREDDIAEERTDQSRAVTLADLRGLADEKVDPGARHLERERLPVLVVVVDQVALDEPDRPTPMADEEDLRRIAFVADSLPVLVELVLWIRVPRRIGPPSADVRLEEPAADERQIRLGQRREVVLRRWRIA